MKMLLPIITLIFLAGCTTYDAAKEVVVERKRQVNDAQLDSTVTIVCNDVAVGAVRRKWNGDFTKWAEFCEGEGITAPTDMD